MIQVLTPTSYPDTGMSGTLSFPIPLSPGLTRSPALLPRRSEGLIDTDAVTFSNPKAEINAMAISELVPRRDTELSDD